MKYLCGAILLLLVGCSNTTALNYYQLPVPSAAAVQAAQTSKLLYVEPVQVAGYLNGRGLVMQLTDVELVVARQHLWVESLDQQLQRQIRDRLLQQAPAYASVQHSHANAVRVSVQFDAFHGQASGYAVVSGRFVISNQPQSQAFNIRVPLADDGYAALVQALGDGVQQLTGKIAQQLNSQI